MHRLTRITNSKLHFEQAALFGLPVAPWYHAEMFAKAILNADDEDEIGSDEVHCHSCSEITHLSGLVGPDTNARPRCGMQLLTGQ